VGKFAFGGYMPPKSKDDPWPPRGQPHATVLNVLKRTEAKLFGAKLVWLRDCDECQTLAVARRDDSGVLRAPRFWPCYRMLTLNDDGTVASDDNATQYVRHWIAVNETDKVFMLFQNSEIYAQPIE
jgi:hypothetical protein